MRSDFSLGCFNLFGFGVFLQLLLDSFHRVWRKFGQHSFKLQGVVVPEKFQIHSSVKPDLAHGKDFGVEMHIVHVPDSDGQEGQNGLETVDDPDNIKLIMQATTTLARLVRTKYNISKKDKKGLKEAITNVLRDVALPLGIGIGATINK